MKRFWFGVWVLLIVNSAQSHRAGPSYRVFKSNGGSIIAQEPVSVKMRNGKTLITSKSIRLVPSTTPQLRWFNGKKVRIQLNKPRR